MKYLIYLLSLLTFVTFTTNCQPISGTSLRLTGTSTMSVLSANQDNYTLPVNKTMYRVSSNTPVDITGISVTGGNNGLRIIIKNIGSNAITLKHEDDGSLSQNRFSFAPGVDIVLGIDQPIELIYDTDGARWNVNATFTGVSGISAPEIQDAGILVTAITSTTATVTWAHTEGDFSIVLLDNAPIVAFPEENVSYEVGEQIGDAFVMGNVSGTDPPTLAVTGLTQNTTYYVAVFAYNAQGGAYRYNTTVDTNSDDFATLPDLTTPTEQFVITEIVPQQESIEIVGTRGNGTHIIAVVSEHEVDSDPVDGVTYTAGDFGAGTEIGTGNYVGYIGTDADFFLSGLTRDTEYFFKVYEFQTTGKFYNRTTPLDSAFTDYIHDETFDHTAAADHAGKTYLEASSRLYYDFSALTFADEANITNGDAGLVDLSPGSLAAVIVGTPTTNEVTFNSASRKGVRGTSTNAVSIGDPGNSIFNSSFETWVSFQTEDGIPPSTQLICGGVSGVSGSDFQISIFIDGHIGLRYETPGVGTTVWTTNSPSSGVVFANGVNSGITIRAIMDFGTDTWSVVVNGTTYTGVVSSGPAISAHDPATFNSNRNFYIAGSNNDGTTSTNGAELTVTRFAVTGLLSGSDITNVNAWMNFTGSATPFSLDDYTINEAIGFDASVTSNELIISGEPLFWSDYIEHDDLIPANLEEFEIEAEIRIDAAPSTTSNGIGIGIKNDFGTDPNNVFVSEFNTDTNGSFGKVFVYSGNNTVTSNLTFRGQSSTAFVPADDDVFRVILKRELQGSDAFWTARVIDEEDNEITTSYVESGRPSSAYFGDTYKAYIHVNGGSFAISKFIVRRVGDDMSPPPAPTTYDIYVRTSGDDGNDGLTPETAVATIAQGLTLLSALGGANGSKTLGIGPGTFTPTTFLQIPTNLGLMEGSGAGVTVITGAPNLYNPFDTQVEPRESFFLIQAKSSSPITAEHVFEDFTLNGANRQITGGIFIKDRNDITIKNVDFENFNFGGLWVAETQTGLVENCNYTSCGGTHPSGSYSTGAIITDQLEDYEFSGGSIDNTISGTGYAHKALRINSEVNLYTNVSFHDMDIAVHQRGGYIDANGNTIPNINFEFHSQINIDGLHIYNNVFTNGFLSFGQMGSAVTNGDIEIDHNRFICGTNSNTIESHAHNLKVHHNFATARAFMFVSNPASGELNQDYEGWECYNNVVEVTQTGFVQGALMSSKHHQIIGALIEHNTVVYTTTAGAKVSPLFFTSTAGQSSITFRDNAIYGQSPVDNVLVNYSGSGFTGSTISYNKSTYTVLTTAISGVTNSNNSAPYGSGNTLNLKLTGDKFSTDTHTFGTYYQPNTGSVLIDADHTGTGDIGAIEH